MTYHHNVLIYRYTLHVNADYSLANFVSAWDIISTLLGCLTQRFSRRSLTGRQCLLARVHAEPYKLCPGHPCHAISAECECSEWTLVDMHHGGHLLGHSIVSNIATKEEEGSCNETILGTDRLADPSLFGTPIPSHGKKRSGAKQSKKGKKCPGTNRPFREPSRKSGLSQSPSGMH